MRRIMSFLLMTTSMMAWGYEDEDHSKPKVRQSEHETRAQWKSDIKGLLFKNHDTPLKKGLKPISRVLKSKTMPPKKHRIRHQNEAITDSELKVAQEWIKKPIGEIENE